MDDGTRDPNRRKAKPRCSTTWAAPWFVSLEHAREQRDAEKIADCQRELLRLGYRVELLDPVQALIDPTQSQ